jgi:hypothetical protein
LQVAIGSGIVADLLLNLLFV